MIRTPEEWLEIYQKGDALALANRVLDVICISSNRTDDLHNLLNVFTAMQLDGVGRVGRSLAPARQEAAS